VAKTARKQAEQIEPAETLVAARSYEHDSIRLIFKPELLRLIGVSYGSIFSWMRAGKFPLAREIGPGGRATKIAWFEHEIMAWLAARPERQMKAPAATELTTKSHARPGVRSSG
jgi:predicted DNA-binding transcriptional regulator AlpA